MKVISTIMVENTNGIAIAYSISTTIPRRINFVSTDGTSHDQRRRGVSISIVECTTGITKAYTISIASVRRTEPPIFCRAFKNNEKITALNGIDQRIRVVSIVTVDGITGTTNAHTNSVARGRRTNLNLRQTN
jgi:hypothetical protein